MRNNEIMYKLLWYCDFQFNEFNILKMSNEKYIETQIIGKEDEKYKKY